MIELIKSSFYHEKETKQKLAEFILNADRFSMGVECSKFEEKFAEKQGREYAVYVNSGSMANLLLIQSLMNLGNLKKGDKVGVSALTWATNIMPLIQLGLVPILIDCEIETLNISPKKLQPYLESIDALFITNVLGLADDIAEVASLCEAHGVLFIEDNCESLGSKISGRLFGNFGLASTFSFFVGHHLSTIEGGMICTDDDQLWKMLLMVRAHGWDRNLSASDQQKMRKEAGVDDFYAKYVFYDLAYNARSSEINGFIGNIQIQFWDEIVGKRQQNYLDLMEGVYKNSDLIPIENKNLEIVSSFALPIVCKTKKVADYYKSKFEKVAEIRPIIAGDMSKQPFFKKYVTAIDDSCENADFIHENGFYIGNNPEMTKEEIDIIKSIICEPSKE